MYVGGVEVNAPPFTLYCKVLPEGQGVPDGKAKEPPLTVQAEAQVLLLMVTLAGAPEKVGQGAAIPAISIWSIANSSVPPT